MTFIVLQAVAIRGLLMPEYSLSSEHQQNNKKGLERWLSCAKHHVSSTKTANNFPLGFIYEFISNLKSLPCVCLLAYDLC